jgi:thiosulfate dehydrogenase
MSDEQKLLLQLERTSKLMCWLAGSIVLSCIIHVVIAINRFHSANIKEPASSKSNSLWSPPKISSAKNELILYGKELIEHTAVYLGPQGKVLPISNGMNCQNCHLQGGTKPFGNNYASVARKYPLFRNRSGKVETVEHRINDCLQRSLNGKPLDTTSREMKAMVAYVMWVGKDVAKEDQRKGFGLLKLPYLNRAASPKNGQLAYTQFCTRCHQSNGQGERLISGTEWKYPPLWGDDSYNTAAGLYRISAFAAFIKANMPYSISHENSVLTDEQAWDIAAYVNSMPRPHKKFPHDWPDISTKPVDHPFGPYADKFTEEDHKYGPFEVMMKKEK